MNAPEHFFLPDVQSTADTRRLAIQKVGVKGLRYPLQLVSADGELVSTVANLTMTVGLPPDVKGTHMSRFVELLEGRREALTQDGLFRMLEEMLLRLDATSGRIELAFPYFIRKTAPVSGVDSLLDYDAALIIDQPEGQVASLTLRVVAPVTSLCPCSKKISEYGAHNQRSHITLEAQLRASMSIEELVRLAEEEASCEVLRPAEAAGRKVGDRACLRQPEVRRGPGARHRPAPDERAAHREWKVASENFESIHNHSAYAELYGCNE